MKYDGIIFDVDGTLWDSTDTVALAYNAAFEECGCGEIRVTGDGIKKEFGKPMDEIADDLLPHLPKEERYRVMIRCMELEEEYLLQYPPLPYPGLEETLKAFQDHCRLFIVSNCQKGYIELFLDVTGLGKYFEDHLCWGDTGLLKAYNIRRMADLHKLKHPVYVGDTIMDEAAAREAEVPFIWASYGFGTVPSARLAIDTIKDLRDLLI